MLFIFLLFFYMLTNNIHECHKKLLAEMRAKNRLFIIKANARTFHISGIHILKRIYSYIYTYIFYNYSCVYSVMGKSTQSYMILYAH